MKNILLTICARGGSKGIKDKNIRLLAGKPLIYYTISQALRWGKAKHILVSSDSEKIAHIAKEFGAEVPFMRPKSLATDNAPKLFALRNAVKTAETFYDDRFDIIMDLDPTSPIRTTKDLNLAMNIFLKTKSDSLFSVVPAKKNPYFNMVEKDEKGKVTISKSFKNTISRRQDAPNVYEMNASIYIYNREYLINNEHISPISDHCEIYIMNEKSATDIDREIDFQFIEFLISSGKINV